MISPTVESLRAFEESIRAAAERCELRCALHLSRGNERQLIDIFARVKDCDWVFSTWRSHYHALLKGIPEAEVRRQIWDGRSISLNSEEHRFFTSSIVGGCLPIAVGVALAVKRRGGVEHVWCFVGDMAASGGMFADCWRYANGFDLPITFVIEDNGMSTNTPTMETWGRQVSYEKLMRYEYRREWPHSGTRERGLLQRAS
jgi:TPP-dependent pyruvate/acetoin dehydrogenase alpha subunit